MRACALALVALAAVPFTAPFPTCDLGLLIGRPVVQHSESNGSSQEPSIADAGFSLASVDDTCKTLKDLSLALAVVPFASMVPGVSASRDAAPHPHIRFSLVSSSVLRI
jgi:hypothetical protein